jgi:hypothetical protein
MNSRDRGFAAQVVRQNIMYYFLGIEGQTVPQIRVPPCVCGNLLRILLANLYPTHNQPHNNDDMRIPVGWHAAFQIARPVACGCTSPQPGVLTPWTHHGWGGLHLVWENSCGEKRKLRRRAASIVLLFVYERGMMEWRVNTVNPFPAEYADPFVTPFMGLSLLDLGQFSDWNEKIEWLSMQK